jgi:hypothetical protein
MRNLFAGVLVDQIVDVGQGHSRLQALNPNVERREHPDAIEHIAINHPKRLKLVLILDRIDNVAHAF